MMLAAYIHGVNRWDGWRRKVTLRVDYYIEEGCGACDTPGCSTFDQTSYALVEVPFEVMKDRAKFRAHVLAGVVAHCKEKYPMRHEIHEEDIFLCPSTF